VGWGGEGGWGGGYQGRLAEIVQGQAVGGDGGGVLGQDVGTPGRLGHHRVHLQLQFAVLNSISRCACVPCTLPDGGMVMHASRARAKAGSPLWGNSGVLGVPPERLGRILFGLAFPFCANFLPLIISLLQDSGVGAGLQHEKLSSLKHSVDTPPRGGGGGTAAKRFLARPQPEWAGALNSQGSVQ